MIIYEQVTNGLNVSFRKQGDNKSSWGQAGMDNLTADQVEGVDYEIIEVDDTPVPTVDELRIAAYNTVGATDEAMTVMLWEIMVEGRTPADVGATSLQVKRAKVKTDNPK
jgi:hypothetical protein